MRNAANRYGSELGRRSLRYVSVRDAWRERKKSSAPGLTARKPTIALTSTGKKVMRLAIKNLGQRAEAEPDHEEGGDRDYGRYLNEDGDGKEGALQGSGSAP